MSGLKKLQELTLGLIIFLVWFDLLCFALIFIGTIFKWAFLTESFSAGFFSAFGISLGALLALAILHMTLTLNSIAFSLNRIAEHKQGIFEPNSLPSRFFKRSMLISLLAIIIIIMLFWLAEVRVNNHKIKVAVNNIESIARSTLTDKAIVLLKEDKPLKDLLGVRDIMVQSLEDKSGISFILPVNKMGQTVYYEVTPWCISSEEKPISQAELRLFVPYEEEKKKFDGLLKDKMSFYSFTRNSLRVFYPVVRNKQIEFILLLDTSRHVSDEYLSKRKD